MASGKLTIETASSTVGINLPLHPAENLPQGTVGDVCYVKSSNTAGSLYLYTPNADGSANNWVNTAPGSSEPPGTAANPASSPKAIRDAGVTADGIYYIDTGSLGVQQVYVKFDSFAGGSIGSTNAWALVSRHNSYSYSSYNQYGYLDSIETTTFGTNSTSGWWIDQNVSGRGWLNDVNWVCYEDTDLGHWATEAQSATLWQTSFINTTSSGYPSNISYTFNSSSWDASGGAVVCWCEGTGCTEHIEDNNGGACSGTDRIRNDNYGGTSLLRYWVAVL